MIDEVWVDDECETWLPARESVCFCFFFSSFCCLVLLFGSSFFLRVVVCACVVVRFFSSSFLVFVFVFGVCRDCDFLSPSLF